MKVCVYAPRGVRPQDCEPGEAPMDYVDAMADGLRNQCVDVEVLSTKHDAVDCDLAVFWSHRHKHVIEYQRARGLPYLVMERGYLGNRKRWTSLGWNGLNGRAEFPHAVDRWLARFDAVAQLTPWMDTDSRREVLLIQQVPGDASVEGVDLEAWYQQVTDYYTGEGFSVHHRAHPKMTRAAVPLADDLARARLVVTYNSTAAVEAVLAGVPTITLDRGSMAWEVTGHRLTRQPRKLIHNRNDWASNLAWKQWSFDEIACGYAWEVVGQYLEDMSEGRHHGEV